jgi:TonB family protein
VLAAGVVARLAWLAVGFWRLARYRREAEVLERAGAVPLLISNEISGPVTFGLRHPVILLPARFRSLPAAMQEAILCHETLHAERRDWLFTVMEELVRAALWFHPAIWWLLGQIQLAREQTVDRRVIELTQARDPYVDALLAMAGARPQLDLAPAPLFLRKRHLKQRVKEIFKEVGMSKKRMAAALAAGLMVMAASCWFVTGAFPLAAAPQIAADSAGVAVDLNGAQLLHRTPVAYPPEARAKGVHGTVTAQVKIDASGEVSDASIVSGPDELRRAVLQSVLGWHFMKSEAGTMRTVSIAFGPVQAAPATPLPAPASIAAPVAAARTITSIDVEGLSDQGRDELLAKLPVHVGEQTAADTAAKLIAAVKAYDMHLVVTAMPNADGTASVRIAPKPQMVGNAGAEPKTIRVGGNVQATNLVSQIRPVYPPEAKQARIQGKVQLTATIGPDGRVQNLEVVSGDPALVPSALDAVKQWVYRPTLLNGNPVTVVTTIDVNYTLIR